MIELDYVSLHNHTSFSIMQALSKPIDLFERAKELGQKAIAITDTGTLASVWDCLKASKQTGVKLIVGSEIYFCDDVEDTTQPLRHLILLAKNAQGYRNLLLLNKKGYDNFIPAFKKAIPRVDWKLLQEHSEGLICLTGDSNGLVSQAIMQKDFALASVLVRRLKDIFSDNLALELQTNAMKRNATSYNGEGDQAFINTRLKQIAEQTGVRCVATVDSHYLMPDQGRALDTLLAIGSGQPITSGARLKFNVPEFHLKSGLEVASFFLRLKAIYPESFVRSLIENTIYFADQCEEPDWVDPKFSNPSGKELPEFPVKQQPDYNEFKQWKASHFDKLTNDVAYLRFACEKGFLRQVPVGREDEYRVRLNEELEVIEYHGFSSYMLIVADYIAYARNNNIKVGPGRGSAGGSLIAYLLGIHIADPIKYKLIFARFHNKAKTSFPDIDTDFSPSGRASVQEYVRKKYGEDFVAHVSNVNTITPKVYLRDLSRTYEFGDAGRKEAVHIGNDLADLIPEGPEAPKTVRKALSSIPLLAKYAEQYPEIEEFADIIGGKARAWSTHAGGLVIGKRSLSGLVPVRRDTHGNFAIEYDKERAEDNGLVKMDMLGLETLDIISNTMRMIKEQGKIEPSDPPDFDFYDEKAYDLIGRGDTLCVFQLADTATMLCQTIKPKSIEEISYINALLRPSAKTIVEDFIAVREGRQQMSLMHPVLQRAFGDTYGFGLYEESLMYLAQDVAGWDLHSADRLRKLTKEKGKNPQKIAKWREEFIEDSVNNVGLDRTIATRVWDEVISEFSGYGFNLSLYFLESVDVYTSEGDKLANKAIQDVLPGEFVRSRDEHTGKEIFVEVISNHDHGEQEIFEIELTTGETVRATMEHKFRTQETGEMMPLWQILESGLSIVIG